MVNSMKTESRLKLNQYFQSVKQSSLVISLDIPNFIVQTIVDCFDGYRNVCHIIGNDSKYIAIQLDSLLECI